MLDITRFKEEFSKYQEWCNYINTNMSDICGQIDKWLHIHNKTKSYSVKFEIEYIEISYFSCGCCEPVEIFMPYDEFYDLDLAKTRFDERLLKREEERRAIQQQKLDVERQQYLKLKEKFEHEHNGSNQ